MLNLQVKLSSKIFRDDLAQVAARDGLGYTGIKGTVNLYGPKSRK